MRHLAIVVTLFLVGACLDDPADHSSLVQAAMDGPRVGISREQHCQLIRDAWQQIEDEKRAFNGCYRKYCAEWIAMLNDEQEQIEDSYRWHRCVGPIR